MRFPNVLVTRASFPGTDRLAPDARVIFEVISPTSDRIEKSREYTAISTLRRTIIVETDCAGCLVLHRSAESEPWTASALTADDRIELPEIGAGFPVADVYEDVVFDLPAQAPAALVDHPPPG